MSSQYLDLCEVIKEKGIVKLFEEELACEFFQTYHLRNQKTKEIELEKLPEFYSIISPCIDKVILIGGFSIFVLCDENHIGGHDWDFFISKENLDVKELIESQLNKHGVDLVVYNGNSKFQNLITNVILSGEINGYDLNYTSEYAMFLLKINHSLCSQAYINHVVEKSECDDSLLVILKSAYDILKLLHFKQSELMKLPQKFDDGSLNNELKDLAKKYLFDGNINCDRGLLYNLENVDLFKECIFANENEYELVHSFCEDLKQKWDD